MEDDQVDQILKTYFKPDEWEGLADIFKIRYRNMYRNFISMPGMENFLPLPDFMLKGKEGVERERARAKNVKDDSLNSPKRKSESVTLRRNPKRAVKTVNYFELKEPCNDRYIFCDTCEQEYLDSCTKCGKLISLKDNPVPNGTKNRARKTAPKGVLEIRRSPIHGFGVFAVRNLRKGIQMGPYEGKITRVETTDGYSWKLMDGRLVDASDETVSNWLRYVNCARSVVEQNIVAFQYRGRLYYRTCRDIEKGSELLVFYGQSFAKNLGIDTKKYFQPDEEELNLDYYSCVHCGVGLSTVEYRDTHQKYCKFRPNRVRVCSKEEEFECKYCQCSLTTKEYVEMHEKRCRKKPSKYKIK